MLSPRSYSQNIAEVIRQCPKVAIDYACTSYDFYDACKNESTAVCLTRQPTFYTFVIVNFAFHFFRSIVKNSAFPIVK